MCANILRVIHNEPEGGKKSVKSGRQELLRGCMGSGGLPDSILDLSSLARIGRRERRAALGYVSKYCTVSSKILSK